MSNSLNAIIQNISSPAAENRKYFFNVIPAFIVPAT